MKPRSYYLLQYDANSHFEDEMIAITANASELKQILKRKLSEEGTIFDMFPDPANITLSRIENDDEEIYDEAQVYNLNPYILVCISNIQHTFWIEDDENDREICCTFPESMCVSYSDEGELIYFFEDVERLKKAGITCEKGVPIQSGEDILFDEAIFLLWENERRSDWQVKIEIKEGVFEAIEPLQGREIQTGDSCYFGQLGIYRNGELIKEMRLT